MLWNFQKFSLLLHFINGEWWQQNKQIYKIRYTEHLIGWAFDWALQKTNKLNSEKWLEV